MRKSVIQPEAMQEVVQQQQQAVKALETKVEEQQQREKDLFQRVQVLTEKLQEAQVAAAITVKVGRRNERLRVLGRGMCAASLSERYGSAACVRAQGSCSTHDSLLRRTLHALRSPAAPARRCPCRTCRRASRARWCRGAAR